MSREGETLRLLQPGLMSAEELKEIISKRGMPVRGCENKTKYQLVELYEQFLLPLSQRKFPNSRLGRLINKKIAEEDQKRSKNELTEVDFQYGFKDNSSGRSSNSSIKRPVTSESHSDRLKPPVDSSTLSSKKICLSRQTSADKALDKIVIHDHSKKNAGSQGEKSDEETLNDKTIKKSDNESDKTSTVVKTHSSKHKESEKDNKDEPQEKRKKIAWP